MGYQECTVERKRHVGIISLNRPRAFNALTMTLMDELIDAFKMYDADQDVDVIVLRGEGGVFCTGHDLDDILGKDRSEVSVVFAKPAELFATIRNIGKPVIASVQGFAIAVGAGLAGACDLVVASEEAQFQTPGAGFGIPCGTPLMGLIDSIAPKKCLEMLFTADKISACEAEKWGLVNKVVPLNEIDDVVLALGNRIASRSPEALKASKRIFYQLSGIAMTKVASSVADTMAMCADTDDVREWLPLMKKGKPIDDLPK